MFPKLIIVKDKAYKSLIEHERMHQVQMIYCGGVLYFWLLYLAFYLIGLVKYIKYFPSLSKIHWAAYRMSAFEVEAKKSARRNA